ncbi:unnamed protein product [Acidithrix sp. C25]|nr:unnamed protein product [Acidithrix sp. C25]
MKYKSRPLRGALRGVLSRPQGEGTGYEVLMIQMMKGKPKKPRPSQNSKITDPRR